METIEPMYTGIYAYCFTSLERSLPHKNPYVTQNYTMMYGFKIVAHRGGVLVLLHSMFK